MQVRQEYEFLFIGLAVLIRIALSYAKMMRNPAIFLVIKSSLLVGRVIFCKGSQQTSFFYNILLLQDIWPTAAVKVIELVGICNSGSLQHYWLREGTKKEQPLIVFFFSHTLLDSRNRTSASWAFLLATMCILIVSYLYTWASFQLLKAFNIWTMIKLFWYELV